MPADPLAKLSTLAATAWDAVDGALSAYNTAKFIAEVAVVGPDKAAAWVAAREAKRRYLSNRVAAIAASAAYMEATHAR